jgi:ribosomal protein L37E
LDVPERCSKCGSYNFSIYGSVYDREFNSITIRISCRRCGSPEKEIKVDNTRAENAV